MGQISDKIYCYVDETGQDIGSDVFIVVVIIINLNLNITRELLEYLEKVTLIGTVKWHKSNYWYRLAFMEKFLSGNFDGLHIYFGTVKKPTVYYFSTLEIIKKAIAINNRPNTQIIVCIDGLDKSSAKKITKVLRTQAQRIRLVKGVKDESEALIRLADRWAGCIRMALVGNGQCKAMVAKAEKKGFLKST